MAKARLNDVQWYPFSLGNTEIFNLHASKSGIDKNKLIHDSSECYPYVTRTELNNGVSDFVSKQSLPLNPKNTISIGLDTQSVFYQPFPYYTGQNVQVLSFSELNQRTALFIIPLIKIQLMNLNWGGNGATLSRLRAKKIMLPGYDKEHPNWQFMNDYVSEKMGEYKVPSLKYSGIQNYGLCNIKWKAFKIGNIFVCSRGKRLTKSDQSHGDIPFVSSTARNNGIGALISIPSKRYRCFENFIGVNNSGSIGAAFYHQRSAIVSDHVTALTNNKLNAYNGVFLATVITKSLIKKFSFNHEISDKLMDQQRIMLPVDSDNLLNWQFMEDYIKSLPYADLL